MNDNTAPGDSQQLFVSILESADIPDEEKQQFITGFENAVYTRTLRVLLELLPKEQSRKLQTTMHFQPDFFLSRVITILQAFASIEQIVEVMEKTSEDTFLEFFDTFLSTCDDGQKARVSEFLDTVDSSLIANAEREGVQTVEETSTEHSIPINAQPAPSV